MDDEDIQVRLSACLTLNRLLSSRPGNYDVKYYRAHLELIINCLVVHLDDDNEDMQMTVNGIQTKAFFLS